MQLDAISQSALLAAVALVCGLVPPLRRLSERQLHAALAAATGIFLGAVFLELLPALSQGATVHDGHDGHDHAGHSHAGGGSLRNWLWVLAGLLAVYLFESLALRSRDSDDRHRHRAVAWAALLGLSIQAFIHGIQLSAAAPEARVAIASSLVHRGAEAFALATIFALAEIRTGRARIAIAAFAVLTPLGLVLGRIGGVATAPRLVASLTGLAAGIFLFVSLCELLPEVFHHRDDGAVKIGLLAVGIGAVVATS